MAGVLSRLAKPTRVVGKTLMLGVIAVLLVTPAGPARAVETPVSCGGAAVGWDISESCTFHYVGPRLSVAGAGEGTVDWCLVDCWGGAGIRVTLSGPTGPLNSCEASNSRGGALTCANAAIAELAPGTVLTCSVLAGGQVVAAQYHCSSA